MTDPGDDLRPDGGRGRMRQAWVIVVVIVGVVAALAAFHAFATIEGRPFKYLSKEPAETLGVPRYIGWQAHTVVLITMTGAVCALLGRLLVRRIGGDRTQARFLLGVGLFTVLLVLDDFLQFHESVYPWFGIHEIAVYPAYGVIIACILWFWGRKVVHQDRAMGLLSGAFLAVSVGVDRWGSAHAVWFNLIEDGAKMLGLTLWSVFLVRVAVRFVLAAVGTATDTRAPAVAAPTGLAAGRGGRAVRSAHRRWVTPNARWRQSG